MLSPNLQADVSGVAYLSGLPLSIKHSFPPGGAGLPRPLQGYAVGVLRSRRGCLSIRQGVLPPCKQNDSLRLSQRLSATVEHTVEHTVPVDVDSLMLIPLFLLRLSADVVPVGGAEQQTTASSGHHFFR